MFFTSSTPTVTGADIGKRVRVTGTYAEYYDQTQISNPTSVTIVDPNVTNITPIDVSVADINNTRARAEELEGMVVNVVITGTNYPSVTNAKPDAPATTMKCC
jgi:predicted extracellular nuclease